MEHELKLNPTANTQVKLLSSLGTENADQVAEKLGRLLDVGDYSMTLEATRPILDEYYDTDDLVIYRTQSVFRIRHEGGRSSIVVKRLVGKDEGVLKRSEEPINIDARELQDLKSTGFVRVATNLLPDINDRQLTHIVTVENTRKDFIMSREKEEYRVSLDSYSYNEPVSSYVSPKRFEIEIEAISPDAETRLQAVKRKLEGNLEAFTFSEKSKYEEGVELFGLNGSAVEKLIVHWLQGKSIALVS